MPQALALVAALYPLVAAIEIGVARGMFFLVDRFDPGAPPSTRIAIAASVCFVLLWPASRLDQRLADFTAYRIVRHIVRLALVGFLAYQLTRRLLPDAPLPAWMHSLGGLIRNPAQLAWIVGAVVVMHFLLRNFLGIRSLWRRSLEFTRLRHA